MSSVTTRIDDLDDKQAIHQAKLLVQAASDASPDFVNMTDEDIAAAVEAALAAAGTNVSPDVTARLASHEPLAAEDAGEAARCFLRVFAEAPGGADVLDVSLAMSDTSADFGLITGPVLYAFVWLAISGDFEFSIGGQRYRKQGLTGKQQADLLKGILPSLIKQFIKAGAN